MGSFQDKRISPKLRIQQSYFGHDIAYLFQPGRWMTSAELIEIRDALAYVNRLSGKNFTYGIFDPRLSLEEFRSWLERMNIGLIRYETEPVGCFYNFIVQEKPRPILHAGLVMIGRNRGVDLLNAPYLRMATLQRKRYGDYYYTNISSTPAIVGGFGELVTDAWPSHKSPNLIRPPKRQYREILEALNREYIQAFFPEEHIEVDFRRFVMRSPSSEMGFDTNMRNLARHPRLEANLFCDFWIDYSRGEDLIQVGKVDRRVALKAVTYLSFLKAKELLAEFRSWLSGRRASQPRSAPLATHSQAHSQAHSMMAFSALGSPARKSLEGETRVPLRSSLRRPPQAPGGDDSLLG